MCGYVEMGNGCKTMICRSKKFFTPTVDEIV